MFVARSIDLAIGEQTLSGSPIIKREALGVLSSAEQIIAAAQAQADAIIENAQQQADALLMQARQDAQETCAQLEEEHQQTLWQQLNEAINYWQVAREQMWDGIEIQAEQLVQQVLSKLLKDVPTSAKIQALVGQLSKSLQASDEVLLRCPPELMTEVASLIEQDQYRHWTLQSDPTIDGMMLVLATPSGEFRCSWEKIMNVVADSADSNSVDASD